MAKSEGTLEASKIAYGFGMFPGLLFLMGEGQEMSIFLY